MRFCSLCGRPLEDDDKELCAACANPNERTGIKVRPTTIILILSFFLIIVLGIMLELSKNLLTIFIIAFPLLICAAIAGYYELVYYHSGESKYLNLTDKGFKVALICHFISFIGAFCLYFVLLILSIKNGLL